MKIQILASVIIGCSYFPSFADETARVVVEKTDSLNVRSEPDWRSEKVGELPPHEIVYIVERNANGWYRIEDHTGMFSGWVNSRFLEEVDTINEQTKIAPLSLTEAPDVAQDAEILSSPKRDDVWQVEIQVDAMTDRTVATVRGLANGKKRGINAKSFEYVCDGDHRHSMRFRNFGLFFEREMARFRADQREPDQETFIPNDALGLEIGGNPNDNSGLRFSDGYSVIALLKYLSEAENRLLFQIGDQQMSIPAGNFADAIAFAQQKCGIE